VVTSALHDCRARADELGRGVARLTAERDRSVMVARHEGATLAEIGAAIGMSGVGVHKLIARQKARHGAAAETD
jgi:DNA-directed RNA polymerase specialized sigma24 family protein